MTDDEIARLYSELADIDSEPRTECTQRKREQLVTVIRQAEEEREAEMKAHFEGRGALEGNALSELFKRIDKATDLAMLRTHYPRLHAILHRIGIPAGVSRQQQDLARADMARLLSDLRTPDEDVVELVNSIARGEPVDEATRDLARAIRERWKER